MVVAASPGGSAPSSVPGDPDPAAFPEVAGGSVLAVVGDGSELVGSSSGSRLVTVTNIGTLPLTISGVAVAGDSEFSKGAEDCTSGSPIAPSSTCTVHVSFDPTSTGLKSASLDFTDDAAGSSSLAPASFDFGSRRVGSGASPSQVVTLSSTGVADLVVTGVSLTGPNADQFAITANSCAGAALVSGSACTIAVDFLPTAAGAKTAQLRIDDNAPGTPQVVSLRGAGNATGALTLPQSPDTTIGKGPKRKTAKRRATFTFNATMAGSQFQCKLDRGPFESCQSPVKVKGLKPGKHVFEVRAVIAGRADSSPATYRWKVIKRK